MCPTLQDVIRSGVENLDSGIGVYAGDEDVYTVFAPLMDKIIEDYHRFPKVRACAGGWRYTRVACPVCQRRRRCGVRSRITCLCA